MPPKLLFHSLSRALPSVPLRIQRRAPPFPHNPIDLHLPPHHLLQIIPPFAYPQRYASVLLDYPNHIPVHPRNNSRMMRKPHILLSRTLLPLPPFLPRSRRFLDCFEVCGAHLQDIAAADKPADKARML